MRESDEYDADNRLHGANYEVGYCRPPEHSRFKPGESGNLSGRAKGSQNLRTLFRKIMKEEEVLLREGGVTKISKAEAILRGLVPRRNEGRLQKPDDPCSSSRSRLASSTRTASR